MKKSFPAVCVLSLGILTLLAPGCAMSELKNTNKRLKEANDRLVAENNRLEQELAASEKEVAEKAKRLDGLQQDLENQKTAPAAPAVAEERAGKGKIRNRPTDGELAELSEPGITVTHTSQGILLRLKDQVFFSPGQAKLSAQGQKILASVARKLNSKYRGNLIRVEGHTDDVPVNHVKNQYPSNWELSTARACAVVRYLTDKGSLSPKRIYPAGFSSYKPIIASKTESARKTNRRVEILILNDRV